jgi:hypothetical protein
MSAWRVIMTDSESLSGVGPVCDQQEDFGGPHAYRDDADDPQVDGAGVYDCCPHPHIELWSEVAAAAMAATLTAHDAAVCS